MKMTYKAYFMQNVFAVCCGMRAYKRLQLKLRKSDEESLVQILPIWADGRNGIPDTFFAPLGESGD